MAFVKLDCGILDSTLWVDRESREIFITALLMAEPVELKEPAEQIAVRSLDKTGFVVPVGWYGFVPAAGVGIVRRAMVEHEAGLSALEKLGGIDEESRSKEFSGRRLVRVDGGYIVLNYFKYRERDYTTAERSRRYREKKAAVAKSRRDTTPSRRDITQAEAEAEAEAEADSRCMSAHVEPQEVSRQTTGGDEPFDTNWLSANWPETANNRNTIAAIHCATALVNLGYSTWPKLRANVAALRAFHAAKADPTVVPGMAKYFRHDYPERYWERDWPKPKSRAQKDQDSNIAASIEWLERSQGAGQ